MVLVNSWLIWRALHGDKKTCREFCLDICEQQYEASWFRKVRRGVAFSTDVRGKKRFTGKPLNELTPALIRAELGPRQLDWDVKTVALHHRQLERAKICMDYLPTPVNKRLLCCMKNCGVKTIFKCDGCGAFGCFKKDRPHLANMHRRYFKARKRLKSASKQKSKKRRSN